MSDQILHNVLTPREYAAVHLMVAALARYPAAPDVAAELAVRAADALIAELAK